MSNYTCKQFTKWYFLAQEIYPFTIALLVTISLLLLPIAALNIMILIAVIKTAVLHTPSNILTCNIAIANLGVAFIAIPSAIAWKLLDLYHQDYDLICFATLFSYSVCALFNGSSYISIIHAIMDRYLALLLHLRYSSLVTNERTVLVCILTWIASSTQIILLMDGENTYYTAIGTTTILLIVIIAFCCSQIFIIIRRHHNQIASQTVNDSSTVRVFPNMTRYRKSVLNLLNVMCCQFVFLTPYFCALIVLSVRGVSVASLQLWSIASSLLFLNSFFNPLLICLKNGDLREAVKENTRFYWKRMKQAFHGHTEVRPFTISLH